MHPERSRLQQVLAPVAVLSTVTVSVLAAVAVSVLATVAVSVLATVAVLASVPVLVLFRQNYRCYDLRGGGAPDQWLTEQGQGQHKVMIFTVIYGWFFVEIL